MSKFCQVVTSLWPEDVQIRSMSSLSYQMQHYQSQIGWGHKSSWYCGVSLGTQRLVAMPLGVLPLVVQYGMTSSTPPGTHPHNPTPLSTSTRQ